MTIGRGKVRLTACLVLAAVTAHRVMAQRTPTVSIGPLIDAAQKYVEEYQQKLSYLLADEVYTQRVFDRNGVQKATRVTKADFFLTFVAARREWLAVRDVHEVDGVPIAAHEDIASVIAKSQTGQALVDINSRYNIGGVSRNFSEPTLPLLLLDAQHRARVKFDLARVETAAGGRVLATVKFKERDEPTLIDMDDGHAPRPVFSSGNMTIDALTGQVLATTIVIDGIVHAEMTTSYDPDVKLGLLLPSMLEERYEPKDKSESVTCLARYTNYRKFGVNVIIK